MTISFFDIYFKRNTGLLIIIVFSVTAAILLPISNKLFLQPSIIEMVTLETEDDAIRIATFLSSDLDVDKLLLEEKAFPANFNQTINIISEKFKIIKLKIFSKSGLIVFSTSPEDIGKINQKEYFHNVVAKGRPYTKVVKKNTKSLEDQLISIDVVETYVPIFNKNQFIGSFEIYYDITSHTNFIKKIIRNSSLLLLIAEGLLLSVVIFVSHKAHLSFIEQERVAKILAINEDRLVKEKIELEAISKQLQTSNKNLEEAYKELKKTQSQILHREKMASIGKLAAGVAHEINNPIGFIASNLTQLNKYTKKLTEFINLQTEALNSNSPPLPSFPEISKKRKELKIDFLCEDIHDMVNESIEGTSRIKRIVQDLRNFSRDNTKECSVTNINDCIDSTLNVMWHELKYKTKIEKHLGEIPLTKCYPHQLNQVFMNILSNAIQSIEDTGIINIKTWADDTNIYIKISDNGCGIDKSIIGKIFDPFFSTKDVGKGIGLGLSISYDIISKHDGEISVQSKVGQGTTFAIKIPIA